MIKIINGDIIEQIEKLPSDFDVCFTSPPYNLSKNNFECEKWDTIGKIQKYGNEQKDNIENYVEFLYEVITKLLNKCEYFFLNVQSLGANKKQLIELQYMLRNYYCDTIIQNKGNGIPNGCNKRVMTNCFEYIHIYSKKNSRAVGTKQWNGTVKNIVNIGGNQRNQYSDKHKAIMNVELSDWILKNFVKEGGKVLDCFGGIGTTMISCLRHNLDGTMVEINKEYCELALKRVEIETELLK